MSTVHYNDNDFISFKEGFIKRGVVLRCTTNQ